MPVLSDDDVRAAVRELPGWDYDGTHLRKEFAFKGFRTAIAFMVRLSFEAEARGHHPDLENHYNRVVVACRSWDEGGITEKDVELAAAIEKARAAFA